VNAFGRREPPPPCEHGNVYTCGFCLTDAAPKCKHGNSFYCVTCAVEAAPKCTDHGNPWFCGFCRYPAKNGTP